MGLYDVSTPEKKTNPELVAGGTLYADSPIGTIIPYGGASAPSGWFLCQGQALSRTTYSELFAVIGTSFGTGDGSSTFNLPDLRGEFLRGAGTNSHSGQGNGSTVGKHQDATKLPNIYLSANSTLLVSPDKDSLFAYIDASTGESTGYRGVAATAAGSDHIPINYTTRPTNTSVNYIIKAKMTAVPADFMSKVDEVLGDMFLVVNDAIDAVGTLTAGQDLKINMPTPPSGYKYFCCDFKGTGNNSVSPRAWASDAVYIHNNTNTSQSYDVTVNITYMKSN